MGQSITTKPIISKTAPETVEPSGVWRVNDFNELIYAQGYEAYLDHALRCPCRDKVTGQAKSDCVNCAGRGWIFINRRFTRVLAQSMSNKKQFTEWSELNRGTAKITARASDRLEFMDRIILLQLEAYHTELLRPILHNGRLIAYPVYEPIEISNIYLLKSEHEKLLPLSKDKYTIEGNGVVFDASVKNEVVADAFNYKNDLTISLRYSYNPVYHVIDANRELMKVRENSGGCYKNLKEDTLTEMPINVLCRKAHFIFGAQEFDTTIQENSL